MKKNTSKILPIILLTITIYSLCIFFIIFNPLYYFALYQTQPTYENIEPEIVNSATNNLVGYFLNFNKLDSNYWTEKEIKHFKDVKNIIYIQLLITIISISLIYYKKYSIKTLHDSLKKVRIILLLPLLLLPIFSYFWANIFHTILFSNLYWIIYPYELSYHLFPETFFVISLITISLLGFIISNLIMIYIKKKYLPNNKQK